MMPTFLVTMIAQATGTIEVEAANEDEARDRALEQGMGIGDVNELQEIEAQGIEGEVPW